MQSKFLHIYLTKYMLELYLENYKTLTKDIKKTWLNKWKIGGFAEHGSIFVKTHRTKYQKVWILLYVNLRNFRKEIVTSWSWKNSDGMEVLHRLCCIIFREKDIIALFYYILIYTSVYYRNVNNFLYKSFRYRYFNGLWTLCKLDNKTESILY